MASFESAEPTVARTYARTNSKGKSLGNASATAPNKRGVEATMTMKDSRGMAKMNTAVPVK